MIRPLIRQSTGPTVIVLLLWGGLSLDVLLPVPLSAARDFENTCIIAVSLLSKAHNN